MGSCFLSAVVSSCLECTGLCVYVHAHMYVCIYVHVFHVYWCIRIHSTMESPNKGHSGTCGLFVLCKEVALFGIGPKCIETIGREYLGISSCVL